MSTTLTPPWYKQRWPWLLMLGPAIVVVAGIATLVIAVQTNDPLVNDDYYKRGNEINEDLGRDAAAAQRGLSAQMLFADQGGAVRVLLRQQGSQPLPDTLTLSFQHPTIAGHDVTATLKREGAGSYIGEVKLKVASKHWYVRLQDPADSWRVEGQWTPDKGNGVMLEPAR